MRVRGILVGLGLFLAGCASHVASNPTGPAACGCKDIMPHIPDRVFFGFGKSELSRDAETTLRGWAIWLTKYPSVNMLMAGNADERGPETYNLALGQRRASVVRDYLETQGVAASRLSTISYGKDCPVVVGHNEDAWQQNRNVIVSVIGFNPQSCR